MPALQGQAERGRARKRSGPEEEGGRAAKYMRRKNKGVQFHQFATPTALGGGRAWLKTCSVAETMFANIGQTQLRRMVALPRTTF